MSPDRPETMSGLLARTLAAEGGATAVGEGGDALSWQQLADRVDGHAGALVEAGIVAGDTVAVRLPNTIAHVAILFAIARLGAVAVHINTRFGPREVQDVLARSGARLLVAQGAVGGVDLSAPLHGVDWTALPALRRITFVDEPFDLDGVRCAALHPNGDALPADRAAPERPCLMFTSSGTTALPKLVVHTHRSIVGHAMDVARRIGLDRPGARLLAIMPFCGTFGNVALMAAVAGGAEIVCLPVYDAARAAALIRERAITHLFADDRMIGDLAALAAGERYDSVRFAAVAAFHPDAVASLERGIAAGLQPHSIYGSSEAQALFALAPQTSGAQAVVTPVSGHASLRYRLIDDRVVVAGEGELLLEGPSTFDHYHGDPAKTAGARDADGYFASGDLAAGDRDGFVFQARLGDVLRLGGFLVNPQEIDDFLQSLPGIAAAQTVGADHRGRPVAVAFVMAQADARPNEAAAIAACRASLARYKVPARIVTVDAFPSVAGPNGVKIQRGRLREMAATALADLAADTPLSLEKSA